MPEIGERVATLEERVRTVTGALIELRGMQEEDRARVAVLERSEADEKAVAKAFAEAAARANRGLTRGYALAGIVLTGLNVLIAKGIL